MPSPGISCRHLIRTYVSGLSDPDPSLFGSGSGSTSLKRKKSFDFSYLLLRFDFLSLKTYAIEGWQKNVEKKLIFY
jgi:hypothetical protein